MTDYVNAIDLSCQALQMLDGSDNPPRHQGRAVNGLPGELARRGEALYCCSIVGCRGDHPEHGGGAAA